MIYEVFSHSETEKFAEELAEKSKKGEIYCLIGDLGAGKTVFSKGFAKGLGITADITSPTFAILNIYNSEITLYHFDVYRINHISEMEDTGYEEFFYGEGICLIEWADLVENIIPKNSTWINIQKDYTKADDYRKIIVEVR